MKKRQQTLRVPAAQFNDNFSSRQCKWRLLGFCSSVAAVSVSLGPLILSGQENNKFDNRNNVLPAECAVTAQSPSAAQSAEDVLIVPTSSNYAATPPVMSPASNANRLFEPIANTMSPHDIIAARAAETNLSGASVLPKRKTRSTSSTRSSDSSRSDSSVSKHSKRRHRSKRRKSRNNSSSSSSSSSGGSRSRRYSSRGGSSRGASSRGSSSCMHDDSSIGKAAEILGKMHARNGVGAAATTVVAPAQAINALPPGMAAVGPATITHLPGTNRPVIHVPVGVKDEPSTKAAPPSVTVINRDETKDDNYSHMIMWIAVIAIGALIVVIGMLLAVRSSSRKRVVRTSTTVAPLPPPPPTIVREKEFGIVGLTLENSQAIVPIETTTAIVPMMAPATTQTAYLVDQQPPTMLLEQPQGMVLEQPQTVLLEQPQGMVLEQPQFMIEPMVTTTTVTEQVTTVEDSSPMPPPSPMMQQQQHYSGGGEVVDVVRQTWVEPM